MLPRAMGHADHSSALQADPLASSSNNMPSSMVAANMSTSDLKAAPASSTQPTAFVNWVAYGGVGGFGECPCEAGGR